MAESEKNHSLNERDKSISPSLEKIRCRKFRKRKKPLSDDDIDFESEEESEIDISLERKLRECARRNNLSPLEVKKLLRKIVGNDHVLALVKLQEEELNNEENLCGSSKHEMSLVPKGDNEKNDDSTPKLTRAKAKALNKKPVSLPSLNEIEPEPEVTALITEEMNTDDEDDEYEPKEEDYIYSEDDLNTTTSDLDSQPRTPLTNASYCSEAESPNKTQSTSPRYSTDGVFKIPRERTTSGVTKEDEIIAKRTRSKFCLQTTPIETIESNFMPPDITRDMYEVDNEIDQEWAQFLNEFSKPLNNTANTEEDDPEDPEYVAADKIPIDAEELKDVNISKKELSDLVAELFDGLIKEGVFLDNIPELETPRKIADEIIMPRSCTKSPQKKKSKFCVKSQSIFTSPTCEHFSDNNLDMNSEQVNPETLINMNANTNRIISQNSLNATENFINNQNESIFSPNIMSTPCINTQTSRISTVRKTQELTQTQIIDNSYINNQSNYTTMPSNTTVVNCISPSARVWPYETNQNNPPTLNSSVNIDTVPTNYTPTVQQLEISEATGSTTQQRTVTLLAYPADGGPPCYKIVPISSLNLINTNTTLHTGQQPIIATLNNINTTMPCEVIDLTADSCIPQPKLSGTSLRTKSGFISHSELYEMWKGDAHKSAGKYYKKFYEKKYNTLKNIGFTTSTKNCDNTQIGFTSDQKKLFDQQLRIHVQLLTQNYLQTYSHPQFWQKAKSQKDLLLELEEKCVLNEKSAFNAWNLKNAIKLINEWEIELAEENEENKKFINFIYHQIERYESNRNPRANRIIKFPPKIMKKILKSDVFLYPEFLPRLPFINSNHADYHDLAPIESHLLAFELEKYLPGVLDIIKKEHSKKNPVRLTCDKISNEVITGKSGRRLYDFYKQEMSSDNYNPIRFFYERGKAPPFEHFVKPFDFNCALPPINKKQQLPMLWKEFCTELEASESVQEVDGNHTNEAAWEKTKQEMKLRKRERKDQKKERKKEKERSRELKSKNSNSQNVVINLNYVLDNPTQYDNNRECSFPTNNTQYNNSASTTAFVTKMERRTSITDYSQVFTRIHEPLDIKFVDDASYLQHLNVQYSRSNLEANNLTQGNEVVNNEILPNNELQETLLGESSPNSRKSGQKRLTDYFSSVSLNKNNGIKESVDLNSDIPKIFLSKTISSIDNIEQQRQQQQKRLLKLFKIQNRGLKYSVRRSRNGFRSFKIIKRLKERKHLRNKLKNLLLRYWKYLYQMCNKYKNIFLKKCFIHFKKIEIYSDFLETLKILCHKTIFQHSKSTGSEELSVVNIENEESLSETISTTGESLIQIIMPKNLNSNKELEIAINSINFFEKVEERFCNFGKDLKFKKFLSILKSFNPDNNSILWFYNKMGKIFLPDHIDLAEIFLHFLLPVDASEASNFFRNYMISNKEIFVKNLTQYFVEYETIIPKIYECLLELDENTELKTEEIKYKLLSLIGENNFLKEWLEQIFVEEDFDENSRIHSSQTSITFEATDLASSLSELQPSEIKYISARTSSISKVFLPEKLASLAHSLINNKTVAVVSLNTSQHIENNIDKMNYNDIDNNVTTVENNKSEETVCKFKSIKDLIENVSLEDPSGSYNESNTICQFVDKPENENSLHYQILQTENQTTPKKLSLIDNENSPKLLIDELAHENRIHKSVAEMKEKLQTQANNLVHLNDEAKSKTSRKSKPISHRKETQLMDLTSQEYKKCLRIPKSKEPSKTELKKDKKIRKKKSTETCNKNNKQTNKRNQNSKIDSKYLELKSTEQNVIKHTESKIVAWSRDEDRIILEEARLDFDTQKNLLEAICAKLPKRSFAEINDRYNFLINLLSQLKSS